MLEDVHIDGRTCIHARGCTYRWTDMYIVDVMIVVHVICTGSTRPPGM